MLAALLALASQSLKTRVVLTKKLTQHETEWVGTVYRFKHRHISVHSPGDLSLQGEVWGIFQIGS